MDKQEVYEILNRAYFSEERHEKQVLDSLPKILNGVKIFVDIGASLGQYTFFVNQTMQNGHIIAVEADPIRFEELKNNCLKWATLSTNKLSVYHAAICDNDGKVGFFTTYSNISGGLFTHNIRPQAVEWQEILVDSFKLDTLLEDCAPDLVKVDVEGSELRVLRGATRILEEGKARFLIELHSFVDPDGQDKPQDVLNFMESFGYRATNFHGQRLFTNSRLLRSSHTTISITNTPSSEQEAQKDSEKIEILPIDYLNSHRGLVEEFKALSRQLNQMYGWHYLLDFAWVASNLAVTPNTLILDAGAGHGLMQWWLADKGANIISVDRVDRKNLPTRFRHAYRVRGYRGSDLIPAWVLFLQELMKPLKHPSQWSTHFSQLKRKLRETRQLQGPTDPKRGTIYLYNQDLTKLVDIESNSIDVIVSISALEHNPPDKLETSLNELMRILKPGGKLIATLGAAKETDWFHEPSKGWCYTEQTLRKVFQLSPDCPSNYDRYDELLEALENCTELRDDLHQAYFKSGDNGMPWGVWNPEYQSVGVVKVKPLS